MPDSFVVEVNYLAHVQTSGETYGLLSILLCINFMMWNDFTLVDFWIKFDELQHQYMQRLSSFQSCQN